MTEDSTTQRLRGSTAVIFVHGIGEQLQGQTLLGWAEPIGRAAHRISLDAGGGGARVLDASLVGGGPSECVIEVDMGPAAPPSRLVLLEARWADAFLVMSPEETAGWARRFAVRAASRAVRHLLRLVRPAFDSVTQLFSLLPALPPPTDPYFYLLLGYYLALFLLVACVAVVRVALIVAYVVALLALAPALVGLGIVALALLVVLRRLPGIGQRVSGTVTALTTVVGDAGAWTSRPIRAAAMAGVVRSVVRHARTLVGEQGQVVLVAHSQGAAVSFQALFVDEEPLASQVDVLFTVGAGVSLLGVPSFDMRAGQFNPVARWAMTPSRPRWVNVWAMWDPVPSGPMGDSKEAAAGRWRECYDVAAAETAERKRVEDFERARRVHRARMVRGPDAGALDESLTALGMDGPLIDAEFERRGLPDLVESQHVPTTAPRQRDPENAYPGPEEWPVHNHGSVLSDHTSYTRNVVEVVEPLTRIALRASLGNKQSRGFAQISVRAVKALALSRLLAAACAVVLAPFAARLLSDIPWLDGLVTLAANNSERAGTIARNLVAGSAREVLQVSLLTSALLAVLLLISWATWRPYREAVTWRQKSYIRRSVPFHTFLLAESGLLVSWVITDGSLKGFSELVPEDLVAGAVLLVLVLAGPWLSVLPSRAPSRLP